MADLSDIIMACARLLLALCLVSAFLGGITAIIQYAMESVRR